MKKDLTTFLTHILKDMGITDVIPEVSVSEKPANGDYTTNVAMRLAGQLKKSPMEIAGEIEKQYQNIHKDNQKSAGRNAGNAVFQAISRVETVPPGFINIFLSEAKLSSRLGEVIKHGEAYGTAKTTKPLRVTVEFTDPNPFKEFHIGHLYSNSVGESLSRLFESQAYLVRRVNYQGDVGMHVAKAIWGMKGGKIESLEGLPLPKRIQAMGEAYVKGAKAFEEDVAAANEMKRINKLIFIAAQRMWKREKAIVPVVDYAAGEKVDEGELTMLAKLYETGRAWSLEYFDTIYKRLGTTFEEYYFESMVGERGVAIIQKHIKDKVFEKSDGAVVYRGEKKGLHTRVFVNQLGLPTYEAKELGLAPLKYDDWKYDRSFIVTGNEINEYFKVLLAALGEVAPELAAKTKHIGHGMVRNADGTKMSSRSGEILSGEGLLDEVKQSIYDIIDRSNEKYSKKEREEIADAAAIAAVKYSLLRVSLPGDVAFDVRKSVSFDGDSGPYLLYTYARAKSVLRKAGNPKLHTGSVIEKHNAEERAIARFILYFPDVVAEAADHLAPSMICNYLFQLAQAFNLFYQKHQIIGDNNRLALTAAAAQVLANGLTLLGISVVERM
jgi:arginyl-tRNA synthetase